jgi:hypothetical protein
MRILVSGSPVLVGYLRRAGLSANDSSGFNPDFEVTLAEDQIEHVLVDGVDSEIERLAINEMEKLGVETFLLQRAGGVRSDRAIKVIYPKQHTLRVEQGLLRAILRYTKSTKDKIKKIEKAISTPAKKRSLLKRILPFLFFLVAPSLQAQPQPWYPINITRFWSGSVAVNAGDSANNALRVNCISGCSASAGFTDNGVFTGSSSSVSPIAALYDTTPPPITDGSAGIFRMNSSRVLLTDGSSYTQPVSGSVTADIGSGPFAVTGTFWQATQPVSIASMPTTPVTGTFWQAIQPVSWSGQTVTATQNTGSNLHVVVDTAPTTAVTGTFWQATQPISIEQTGNNNAVDVLTLPNVTVSTFPDNEPFNIAQVAGSAVATGNGTAAGSLRVSIASDSTGNTGVAQASTTSGQLGHLVQGAVTTSNPTYTTAQTSPLSLTTSGLLRTDAFPARWTCALDNIAATLTQCQAAAGAGLRHWITHVIANSTTSTAGTFAIRQGTGTNCGTGTAGLLPGASTSRTYVLPANTAAAFQASSISGIGATAANAICVIGVATNTTNITISGYTAP